MMFKYLLKASFLSAFCLPLVSQGVSASPTNFYHLAGSNPFSSAVLTYQFDFSEFLCSDYGGILDCENSNYIISGVFGVEYVTHFTAVISGLSSVPNTQVFTKEDLNDFFIYIDGFGNFASTPYFEGDNFYTSALALMQGIPLPDEGEWELTVDFTNGQTIYTADEPMFPIPEPLTLLGASTAIALGAGFKRHTKRSE